jgi:uncharacterized protein YjgD (DUF1641 family)
MTANPPSKTTIANAMRLMRNPDFATGINLFLSIFDYKPR